MQNERLEEAQHEAMEAQGSEDVLRAVHHTARAIEHLAMALKDRRDEREQAERARVMDPDAGREAPRGGGRGGQRQRPGVEFRIDPQPLVARGRPGGHPINNIWNGPEQGGEEREDIPQEEMMPPAPDRDMGEDAAEEQPGRDQVEPLVEDL